MLEDDTRTLSVADTLDHRGMVQCIGKDNEVRYLLAQRAQCRPVGNITGGEDQRGFLAMQVSELFLKLNVIVIRAGNIARSAGPCPACLDRLLHGGDHGGTLPHAEIVIGTPDCDIRSRAVLKTGSARKFTTMPFQFGKDPVPAFIVQSRQFAFEKCFEIHRLSAPPQAIFLFIRI